MTKKQKLELTWVGKEVRPRLEPRILREISEKSYHAARRITDNDIFDNVLIHGDNLLALKALEADYTGMVKCIYIDPPYNTGNAFEHYDDGLEHSIWLSLMRDRLDLLKKLLSKDGYLTIQIDDNEFARLYLLMIEIFGSKNLKVICVKMSESSGLKMGAVRKFGIIPKLKEYIIIAKPSGLRGLRVDRVPKESWDTEYNILLDGFTRDDKSMIDSFAESESISDEHIALVDQILKRVKLVSVAETLRPMGLAGKDRERWLFDNAYRICQCATSSTVKSLADEKRKFVYEPLFSVRSKKGENLYLVRATYPEDSSKPRLQLIFAEDNLMVHPGDLWTDIKTTGLEAEGQVSFKNGKKPELLIRRIIQMGTEPGDLVLDSFGGSGTTAAVAHKMRRRWITIELGDHAYSHIVPRLRRAIENKDTAGATSIENWTGGGGFRYYELAPSLLQKDRWGREVISREYDAAMLAEALCKLEGFTYAPSADIWWQHGRSSETDYLYVTTQTLGPDELAALSDDVGERHSLLVLCAAWRGNADQFVNLTLRKIPNHIRSKCEWGKDSYSLNVADLPMSEPEPAPPLPAQSGLFDGEDAA